MADAARAQPTPHTRVDRRKARTRRALLDSARAILAERGSGDVSIQEITERADVGFGSFYNHFGSKIELFELAVAEVLEEHGARLDRVTSGIEDPAEAFAVSVRATASLADTQPAVAEILLQAGLSYLIADHGLVPRALRDLQSGIDVGRFTVSNPHLGLVSTAGCLLAYLQVRLHHPDVLDNATADELAEEVLRMLGMTSNAAQAVAHLPIPHPRAV